MMYSVNLSDVPVHQVWLLLLTKCIQMSYPPRNIQTCKYNFGQSHTIRLSSRLEILRNLTAITKLLGKPACWVRLLIVCKLHA